MKLMKRLTHIALCLILSLILSLLLAMSAMLDAAAMKQGDVVSLRNASVDVPSSANAQTDLAMEEPEEETVGYSSARVERVQTYRIKDIMNYEAFPNEDCYKITDARGICELGRLIFGYVNFSEITIYLANDIDMDDILGFDGISYDLEHTKDINGTPRYYFTGTLDGQGYAIRNLRINSTQMPLKYDQYGRVDMENGMEAEDSLVCVGLFGITGDITVRNLIIDQSCKFSYSGTAAHPCVSALIGKAVGTVKINNVWNKAQISGGRHAGSFIARCDGTYEIKNTTNIGNVRGSSNVGGFIGYDGAGGLIENCRNVGSVQNFKVGNLDLSCAAGFVGRARASVRIVGCINNGNVKGGTSAGAFLGLIKDANTVQDCINYGILTAIAIYPEVGVAFGGREAEYGEDGSLVYLGSCEIEDVLNFSGVLDPTLIHGGADQQHTWFKEGTVTVEPTHTTEGCMTYSCMICNEQYTESIPMLTNHIWDNGTVKVEPTHTEEGIRSYFCPCGESYTESIPMLTEHIWGEGVIIAEPTHAIKGVRTFFCLCGATKSEMIPTAGEHTYGDWIAYDQDRHQSTCECGDALYAPHRWSQEIGGETPEGDFDALGLAACLDCGMKKNSDAIATEMTSFFTTTEAMNVGKNKEDLKGSTSKRGCSSTVYDASTLALTIALAAMSLRKRKEE